MTFELKDGVYYKGFMQFEFVKGACGAPASGNFLGAIFTTDPERKDWQFIYRMRYYVDDIMDHNSEDIKHWEHMDSTLKDGETVEGLWESTLEDIKSFAEAAGAELHVAVVDSDKVQDMMKAVQSLPNMNVNTIPVSEAKTLDSPWSVN